MAIAETSREDSPARLQARTTGGLDDVPTGTWDELTGPGSAALRHGFLRAWERVELTGLRSRPLLAFLPGSSEPVAACPGFFYDLDLPSVRAPDGVGVVELIRRLVPGFLVAHTYELGSPTPLTNPFLVNRPELRPAAVRALIEAGLEEADRNAAEFTLVQNFTSKSTPAGELLAEIGFAGVPILPTAVLDLPYDSFDSYLGAMRAQYRRRAKQAFKRSSQLTVEHLPEFAHLADDLARLWRSIYDRATEVRREILPASYFEAISSVQETSVLLLRRPDGSIASFALLLDDAPWLSFLQCGFEREGREEGAYFRLLYEIARFAIEAGYEQVDLGITTLAPKFDIGAVPVPLFAWLRHRNPAIQKILLALARGPLRPPDLERRKVFKDEPAAAAELVARRRLVS